MLEHEADIALDVGAELGEGPLWDDRNEELVFVDILGKRVHRYRPAGGQHRSFDVGRVVGSVALRDDGGLLLAAHDVFLLADREGRHIERFGSFEGDGELVRFNDGKVDPSGRFLVGTMHWGASDALGALYALHGDGRAETLLEGVTISNGMDWAEGGALMYYVDTPTGSVDAFDVEPTTSHLRNRRVVARMTEGRPDGLALDEEGMLWVAVFEGARVERIDPRSGRVLAVVPLPVSQATSVAFGGPGLDTLYITTAREGFDAARRAAQPHAGDLFVAHPGVSGAPPNRFAHSG